MIKIKINDLIMNLIQHIDDHKDIMYNTEEEITTYIDGILTSLCFTLNRKYVEKIYEAISEHMHNFYNIDLDILF